VAENQSLRNMNLVAIIASFVVAITGTTTMPVIDYNSTTTERVAIIREIDEVFEDNAEVMKRIGDCESDLIPEAKSTSSTATGVFQILKGTWEDHKCEGNRKNYKDNIACAKKIHDGPQGLGAWSESFKCWRKTFKVK